MKGGWEGTVRHRVGREARMRGKERSREGGEGGEGGKEEEEEM